MFWIPDPIWIGKTAFIIGGGPSVKRTDLSLIHDRKVIGVNTAFKLGDWVDIGWFGDKKWIDWNEKEFKEFKGIPASCNTNNLIIGNKRYNWIHFLRRGKPFGIDTKKGYVAWNKSSGNSAINLAYHLGSRRIVLIGFDSKDDTNGDSNYHKEHKHDGNPPYGRFLSGLKAIQKDAKELGVEILNASPDSSCEFFPKGELKDFIDEDIVIEDEPVIAEELSFITSLYDKKSVIELAKQIRKNTKYKHNFICHTDIPIKNIIKTDDPNLWKNIGPTIMIDASTTIHGNIDKLCEIALNCTEDKIYMCRPYNEKLKKLGAWATKIVIYNGNWEWVGEGIEDTLWPQIRISKRLKDHNVVPIQDEFPGIYFHKTLPKHTSDLKILLNNKKS